MQNKIKYIVAVSITVLIVMYLFYSMHHFISLRNDSVCTGIDIKMDVSQSIKLLSVNDIKQQLVGQGLLPIGKKYKTINAERIEEFLKNNPMLKEVECYKSVSGLVTITVKQHVPKFRVVGYQSYYINQDKERMPISPNYAAYVPVVSGRVTLTMTKGELFDFVSFLEQHPFWNSQIEQIHIRDDLKVELVPRVGDGIILLGSFERFEAKLRKLEKLYLRGFNVVGWNKYKVINLEYKDQVVCSQSEFVPKTMELDSTSIEINDSVITKKI